MPVILIGVHSLWRESEKNPNLSTRAWVVDQKATILEPTVIIFELFNIALIHMHIVNTFSIAKRFSK